MFVKGFALNQGTLTLSGASTYTGGTTISAGTVVASGGTTSGGTLVSGGLGTGAVSIASGATLAVGQAANRTLSPLAGGAQSLSLSSLSVNAAAGNIAPFLTFNLFANGTSDTLFLTGTGTALSFSSANGDKFIVGFASGDGSVLSGGVFDLITFTNPSASDTMGFDLTDANNSFAARGTGNASSTTGNFQWTKASSGNVTGLQYVVPFDGTTPEPGSALLLIPGLLALGGTFAAARSRQAQQKKRSRG